MDKEHIKQLELYKENIKMLSGVGYRVTDMAMAVANLGIYIADYEIERAKNED